MIPIKYRCLFLLHKRDKAAETCHLMCRIKWNCSRSIVSFNLGYAMDPNGWMTDEQMCRPRSMHGPLKIPGKVINNEIERYRDAVRLVFDHFAKCDIWPSVSEVSTAVKARLGFDIPKMTGTIDVFALFLQEESVRCSWTEATIKKLTTMRNHMSEFPAFATFDGFTTMGLTTYMTFLREGKGHNDSTIKKELAHLRWFLSWADKKKLVPVDDWKTFRPRFRESGKPVVFLEWDELMRVWNYEAPEGKEYLNDARDIFLFSCFTSLRYSDAQALRWFDVHLDTISIVTKKTAEALTIDLNDWSQDIIARHIDRNHGGDHVLPQMPVQTVNRCLKTICRECGINSIVHVVEYHGAERTDAAYEKWGLITTHAGRRTFISNALLMGIAPTTVMQWTGHNDFRAMRPYIGVAGAGRKEAMKAFNRRNGDTKQ